jgi:hypothetical protein
VAAPTPAYQQPIGYQQQQTAMPMAGAYGYQQSGYQQPVYQQPMAQAPLGYASPYANSGPTAHTLTSFSVPALILLHFVTGGIASLIVHHGKHGNLPKIRHDDPSAGAGIGLMFVPIFNLYWRFFSYIRLCDRLNEQRLAVGLPPTAPRGMAIAYSIIAIIPYVNIFIGLGIVGPIFSGMLQSCTNELVRATRGPMA